RLPDGKLGIESLSSALYLDFFDGSLVGSDGTPLFSEQYRRIWFNMPQPTQLPDKNGKSIGRKLIDGLDCEGFVTEYPDRTPGGYKLEYWVSRDIQRIVYEKITARTTKQTYRL